MRPAIIAIGNRRRALLLPAVLVDPRARPATVGEADAGAATLEIVPFRAIEGVEKFGVVQPVQLPSNPPRAVDEPGVPPEIEEASLHQALSEKRRAAGQQSV